MTSSNSRAGVCQAASRIATRCESEGCKVVKGLGERIQSDCKCVIQLEAIDERDVIVLLDEKGNTLLRESYRTINPDKVCALIKQDDIEDVDEDEFCSVRASAWSKKPFMRPDKPANEPQQRLDDNQFKEPPLPPPNNQKTGHPLLSLIPKSHQPPGTTTTAIATTSTSPTATATATAATATRKATTTTAITATTKNKTATTTTTTTAAKPTTTT
ncbi:hypothetical protein Pelo_18561 [Pelomyxa schiedti]|nr:hypothetical protein Pelo_18561 [Pelomyxa schiedti]